MTNMATTVDEYLAGLTEDRRIALDAVRHTILENMPQGVVEGFGYSMISYHVPHSLYPMGYHCDPKQPLPVAALASQKNSMSLHLFFIYGNAERTDEFRRKYLATGKKLDMGKACVRFKKLDDLPLDVVGEMFKGLNLDVYMAKHEAFVKSRGTKG